MKKISFILAGLVVLITLGLWASGGFHTGWSQNQIPVNGVDEITGIEFTTYEDGFVAGLDVLIGGLVAAAGIVGISIGVSTFQARSQANAN